MKEENPNLRASLSHSQNFLSKDSAEAEQVSSHALVMCTLTRKHEYGVVGVNGPVRRLFVRVQYGFLQKIP